MLLDDALPLGLVVVPDDEPEPVADGEVALPDPLTEPEPVVVVVLLLPGVVVVPGDADGVVRSGVLPTRSVSVRLQAMLAPASNASAQKPDSIFFIAACSSLWGVEPRKKVATDMPVAADLTGSVPSNTTASYLAVPAGSAPASKERTAK
ncbi:MAG TPA: hypothetical protein VIE36_04085 [Methylomirabilota bacterium]